MSKNKNSGKPGKPLNPEERLQASVAHDIKIRHMEEHAKAQSDAVLVAQWEATLLQKDVKAAEKRLKDKLSSTTKLISEQQKAVRKAKIHELYKREELEHERELESMGLAFRRDRS